MSEADPFLIRGHHLGNFAHFNRLNRSPESMTKHQIEVVSRNERASYVRDIIGDSESTIQKFADNHRAVYEQYVQLPKFTPITITVGAPDGICGSCVIGNHCKAQAGVLLTEDRESPYFLKMAWGDVLAVKKFLAIGNALARVDILVPPEEIITSDADYILRTPEEKAVYEVPVTAPAEYVKRVLDYWELDRF